MDKMVLEETMLFVTRGQWIYEGRNPKPRVDISEVFVERFRARRCIYRRRDTNMRRHSILAGVVHRTRYGVHVTEPTVVKEYLGRRVHDE